LSATNSAAIIVFMASATSGFFPADLGDVGYQASATGTSLRMNVGAVTGTYTGLFTGYYTGS
jgi:hypothetical protein